MAHSPTGQDDWNRLYGNPRFRDYMRVHEIMEVFPEKRHAGHATKLPTPTVGPLPPFTMNAMYFRDDNPIASLLRQHRQNPDFNQRIEINRLTYTIGTSAFSSTIYPLSCSFSIRT